MDPEAVALINRLHAQGASDEQIHAALQQAGYRLTQGPAAQQLPGTVPSATPQRLPGPATSSPIAAQQVGALPLHDSLGRPLNMHPAPTQAMSMGNVLRFAEQGATFGFGDEINAGARALYSRVLGDGSQSYSTALNDERQKMAAAREENPTMAGMSTLLGGLAPAALTMGGSAVAEGAAAAPGALKMGAQMWKGAKLGMGAGFLAGAGGANPDPEGGLGENLMQRFVGGAEMAGPGALLGGAIPGAAAGLGWAADRTGVSAFLGNRAGAVGRGAMSAGTPSPKELERDLALKLFGKAPDASLTVAEKRAIRLVGQRFERGGADLPELRNATQQAPMGPLTRDMAAIADTRDRPVFGADVGGRPAQELLAASAAVPSRTTGGAAEALESRAVGRPLRLAGDVDVALGARRVRMPQAQDELWAAEDPGINDAYNIARADPRRIGVDQELQKILGTKELQKIHAAGVGRTELGVAVGNEAPLEPLSNTVQGHIDALRKSGRYDDAAHEWLQQYQHGGGDMAAVLPASSLDANTMDRLVQGLGHRIEDEMKRPAPDMLLVKNLTTAKEKLETALEGQSPAWQAARTRYQGVAEQDEGLALGHKFAALSSTPDQMAADMRGLPQSRVQEGMQAGLRQRAIDRPVDFMTQGRAIGRDQRVEQVFGPDATASLRQRVGLERTMRTTEDVALRGSPTAARLGNVAELEGEGGDVVQSIAKRGVIPTMFNKAGEAAASGISRVVNGVSSDVAGATGDLLLAGRGGRDELQQLLEMLSLRRNRQAAAAMRLRGGIQAGTNWLGQQGNP